MGQISVLMTDSGAESYGDSFDTHHDHVVAKDPKLLPISLFDPIFGHDTRVKVKLLNLSDNLHTVCFEMSYLTSRCVK